MLKYTRRAPYPQGILPMGHIYCAGSRIQAEGDKEYDEQRPDETATDKTDDSEKLHNL